MVLIGQLYFAALDITHYTCMLVFINGMLHLCSDLIESNVILGHEVSNMVSLNPFGVLCACGLGRRAWIHASVGYMLPNKQSPEEKLTHYDLQYQLYYLEHDVLCSVGSMRSLI